MRSPFELQSLIEWLKKHPADWTYDFDDGDGIGKGCLVLRYLRAAGFNASRCGFTNAWDNTSNQIHLPQGWVSDIAMPEPHTFGAALSRARALEDIEMDAQS